MNLDDMATGEKFRHASVIGSHIFQCRWRRALPFLTSFTDIDDPRNGLLLYKPVEDAFDRARLCIEVKDEKMTFRILDKTLRKKKLACRAEELRSTSSVKIPSTPLKDTLQTTFGDLDGQELHFPEGSSIRPSKRLLALHSRASWIFAKKNYEMDDTTCPEISLSDDGKTEAAFRSFSSSQLPQ